jgi:outer membrane protein assembly factor BamB
MDKDIIMHSSIKSVLFAVLLLIPAVAANAASNWPNWRGPNADGSAPDGNPPLTWSDTENIKWKVPMPDTSNCTPVIWGDKIFIQAAVPSKKEPGDIPPLDTNFERPKEQRLLPKVPTNAFDFNLVCLDKNTGKILWERNATTAYPHEGIHPDHGFASYSPVTDGELVWVSFGTFGMYCYDVNGNEVWNTALDRQFTFNGFGEGSSPAIAGDLVYILQDHEGNSKIHAFNKKTGALVWEQDREEGTGWSTPYPVEVDGKTQIVVNGSNLVRSYDATTGDLIWQCSGLERGSIPSPVSGFGKVYCMTGYLKFSLLAIELGKTGDLTASEAVAWSINENTPYVPCPLLYEDQLYFTEGNKPKLSSYNAKTGEPIFTAQKLPGQKMLYASPVGAGGRVYIAGRKGTTLVLKHGTEFEILATNVMDDGFDSSPVVVGDELFLKGKKFLYCISESK